MNTFQTNPANQRKLIGATMSILITEVANDIKLLSDVSTSAPIPHHLSIGGTPRVPDDLPILIRHCEVLRNHIDKLELTLRATLDDLHQLNKMAQYVEENDV